MGSGKTTVAKLLAEKLNRTVIDLDEVIEQTLQTTICNYFKTNTEEAFRTIERQVLQETLNQPNSVIAAGGGTPCCLDNISLINAKALSIYLRCTNQTLYDRLQHAKDNRPLIKALSGEALKEYIIQTIKIREPFYKQAALHLNADELLHQIDSFLPLLS